MTSSWRSLGRSPRRLLAACVAASVFHTGWVQAGELISAEQVVQRQAAVVPAGEVRVGPVLDAHARLQQLLDRSDVTTALIERGVDPDQARDRVAALTDAQAAQLLAGIDSAPAGASEVVGTVVLVGVLLVFSDILGFTRLFPFLRPAR